MSLNIQTSTGLLEISTKVTKDKVIEALGYEPANETHVKDNTVHITPEERENWNNKFDGTYSDLEGSPNITEDESGNLVIADNNGNAIMQVDENGITTTNVNTKTVTLDGEDLGSRLDSLESISLPNILDNETGDLTIADENGNTVARIDADGIETTTVTAKNVVVGGVDVSAIFDEHRDEIDNIDKDLFSHKSDKNVHITSNERTIWNNNVSNSNAHIDNKVVHVTSSERTKWNNKSDFSGDFNDLKNKPNITDDGSGELVLNDSNGNIIAKINESGFETTTVTAKSAVINGVDVVTKLDEYKESIDDISEDLSSHTSDANIHITSDERTTWNNKSDFSGDYHDLENAPNIEEDNSGEVIYADESGNVIAKIGEAGFETTQVTVKTVIASGVDVGSTLSSHVDNDDIHITREERADWNAKATTSYVDQAVAGIVNSAPDKLNTLDELAAALGDDENFATTVTNSLAEKAKQSDLDSHVDNKSNPHNVTKAQVGLGNVDNTSDKNKPVSDAQQAALDNLKSELSETIVSEAKEWIVADEDGNIVAKVDSNGLETTTVTAKAVIINGTDVKAALDSIGSDITNITEGDIVVAEANHAVSADTATNANHATNADHASSADTASDSSKFGGQLPSYYAKADHDHNEYVTEDELNGKGYLTSVPSEYITETELNSKGYLTEGNLSSYAKKTEIPTVVNNLESTSTTAALSAKQGAVLKAAIDSITEDMEELGGGDMMKAKYDTNNDGIVDNAEKLEGHHADYFAKAEHTHTEYSTTDHTHDDLAKADHEHDAYALVDHTHDEYLTTDDISVKADKSYVEEEINAAKLDASNKDTVVLVEAQKCIAAVQNTFNTHVDNDDIHISAEERISWNNKADKTYVDDLIKGLSAEGTADAGVVQAALTAHTNDKNNPHGVTAAQVDAYTKAEIDDILSSKTFVQIITWEDDD